MNIPVEVKIGGHIYTIEQVLDLNARDNSLGALEYDWGHIKLDDRQPQSKKEETLLHEILHGVFKTQGLDEYKDLKEHEEVLVNSLASGLFQVLKDNKLHFDE